MTSTVDIRQNSGNRPLPQRHGILHSHDMSESPAVDGPWRAMMHPGDGLGPTRTEHWLAYLEREMAAAAAAMEGELGADSMCTVHKDGRVTGGLKYQEGRLSAFAEARRLARARSDIEAALAAQLEKWSDELERRRTASPPSMAWVAYATGGVEASREAREKLRSMSL